LGSRRIVLMGIQIRRFATLDLRKQVEFFGGSQVSLDSLWRASGSPAGHDPRSWSELADPLLSGFAAYLDNLDGAGRSAAMARPLWRWEEESKDPW
jgi:hypothetical protein